jgi:mono/diheme cytochrome c family protein
LEEHQVREWQSGWKWILIGAIGLSVGCSDDSSTGGGGSGQPKAPSQPVAPAAPPPDPSPAEPTAAAPVEDTRSEAELVEAGRGVYMGNCIACHNPDATKDGALGPAVAGASLELIEARVLRSEYPEGYTPKRDTRVMVALPHLAPKMKELTVYLASLE